MYDFLSLFIIEIKRVNNTLDIVCYTDSYDSTDDEFIYCYRYKVKNIVFNNDIEKIINNYKKYSFGIFDKGKKIIFNEYKNENFDVFYDEHEKEIVLENVEIFQIKIGFEKVLYNIIVNYIDRINIESKKSLEHFKNIGNMELYIKNELEKVNRKIKYYEKMNEEILLYKNVGKHEILEKILYKINENN